MPGATLELFDRDHQAIVDDVEVGESLDYRVRVAVRCGDLAVQPFLRRHERIDNWDRVDLGAPFVVGRYRG